MQPELFVGHSLSRFHISHSRTRRVLKFVSAVVAFMLILALMPLPQAQAADSGALKLGMSGAAVKTLQDNLVKRGYLSSADGKFGNGTLAAVKLFQKHAGLTQDGVAGAGTQDKLYGLMGSGKTNLTLKTGTKSSQVTILQTRLKYLGYLSISSVTNYFGASTKEAVKKFQAKKGLVADGVAGPKTLVKLYSPNKGEMVVADAKKYLGVKYVYGSADPNVGFDCSGLVYYVYKHFFDVTLPRSAQGLANGSSALTTVKLSEARPGDILCFGNSVNSVGHVGIYIGNNQFIEAPQTGEVVKITDLHRAVAVVKRVFTWG